MSGGSWEFTMGVMSKDGLPCSGRDEQNHSGFKGPYCFTTGLKTDGVDFPTDIKYYDVYRFGTVDEEYNRRILGDATGEMGPFTSNKYGTQTRQIGSWYANEAWFIRFSNPWFARGTVATNGTDAGMFAFGYALGSSSGAGAYRVVLTI